MVTSWTDGAVERHFVINCLLNKWAVNKVPTVSFAYPIDQQGFPTGFSTEYLISL